jgi:hypothetical protein
VTSSRFVAEFASLKKAEAAVSRFIVRHPKLSRFVAHIPGASKFLRLPAVAAVPNVAPVYNARARKWPAPRFRL